MNEGALESSRAAPLSGQSGLHAENPPIAALRRAGGARGSRATERTSPYTVIKRRVGALLTVTYQGTMEIALMVSVILQFLYAKSTNEIRNILYYEHFLFCFFDFFENFSYSI